MVNAYVLIRVKPDDLDNSEEVSEETKEQWIELDEGVMKEFRDSIDPSIPVLNIRDGSAVGHALVHKVDVLRRINNMEHSLTNKGITKTVCFKSDTTEDDRLVNPGNVTRMRDGATGQKIGRNQICPCGSGKKFKACCLINRIVDKPKEKSEEERALSKQGMSAMISACSILAERGLK